MTTETLERHDAEEALAVSEIEREALAEYQLELERSEGRVDEYFRDSPDAFTLDGLLNEVEQHGYERGHEAGINEAVDALQDVAERLEETVDETMLAVSEWVAELHARFASLEETVERLFEEDEEDQTLRRLELEIQAQQVDETLITTALQCASLGQLMVEVAELPSGARADAIGIEVESAYWTLVKAKVLLKDWYTALDEEVERSGER